MAREVEDRRRENGPWIAEQSRPDEVVKERKEVVLGTVCNEELQAQDDAEGAPTREGDAEGSEP